MSKTKKNREDYERELAKMVRPSRMTKPFDRIEVDYSLENYNHTTLDNEINNIISSGINPSPVTLEQKKITNATPQKEPSKTEEIQHEPLASPPQVNSTEGKTQKDFLFINYIILAFILLTPILLGGLILFYFSTLSVSSLSVLFFVYFFLIIYCAFKGVQFYFDIVKPQRSSKVKTSESKSTFQGVSKLLDSRLKNVIFSLIIFVLFYSYVHVIFSGSKAELLLVILLDIIAYEVFSISYSFKNGLAFRQQFFAAISLVELVLP